MKKSLDAIKVLIIVNVILYLVTFHVPGMENTMFETLALYFPQNKHFSYWQYVTNMFMHGGFTHLLFNMFALFSFGTPLEHIWGVRRFLFFYFVSGIGAALIYSAINYYKFDSIYNELISSGLSLSDIHAFLNLKKFHPELLPSIANDKKFEIYNLYAIPAVGASGAIYGILVAFGMLFPNAKLALIFLPVPIAAKYFIPVLIAIDLFSGVTGFSIFGGGVAHFAHVGGAIIGFILMWFWRKRDINHPDIIVD